MPSTLNVTRNDQLISVVIPAFNRAHLIGRSIRSVVDQTYRDWELIVVDDRSTDDTVGVVESFARDDRRIRWVRNETGHHSPAGARNRGLEEVRGDYVAFLDSDDRWPEYHLAEMEALLRANPDVDWVFGDLRREDDAGNVLVRSKFEAEWPGLSAIPAEARGDLHVLRPEHLVDDALEHGFSPGLHTSLIRARVFERTRMRDLVVGEDHLLALECASLGFKFAYVNNCHLYYLKHNGNISGANVQKTYEHGRKVCEQIERFWSHYVPRHVTLNRRRRRIVRRKLADHLVWEMGNGVLRPAGRRAEALRCIARGISLAPWRWNYWKTFAGTMIRG